MRGPIARAALPAVVLVIAAGSFHVGRGDEVDGAGATAGDYDCGILALHTMLALEGRPTPLRALESRLPSPPSGGYSLAQLRDAARVCGLDLDGVEYADRTIAQDRPMLAYVRREGQGHFLVIRPVGPSGRMAQVIDPSGGAYVLDIAELVRSPGWTGIALVPRRRLAESAAIVAASVVAAAVLISSLRWMPRGRGRSPGPPRNSTTATP